MMYHRAVASVKPSISNYLRRRLGIFVIALHDYVASNDDFTHSFSVARRFAPPSIDNPQFTGGQQFNPLARLDLGALLGGQHAMFWPCLTNSNERSRFSEAVDVRQNPPKFPLNALNRSSGRRSASCQDPQATPHLGSELRGKVGQQDEHCWRGAE